MSESEGVVLRGLSESEIGSWNERGTLGKGCESEGEFIWRGGESER